MMEDTPEVLSPVAARRRELEARPDDPEARLALARALADGDQLAEALALYDSLATPATGYLERALADLVELLAAYPEEHALRELMGDVYARAGRFEEAMEMYRWLLAQDEPNNLAGG